MTTATIDETDTDETLVSAPPPRGSRLAAAARSGASRRKATVRKAPAKRAVPNASRNAKAAARGKYADRIVPAVKLGASAFRDPVKREIVVSIAEPWAASLDRLAAEDARVDALLSKASTILGQGGAWGEFSVTTLTACGALLVASGRSPSGIAGVALAAAVAPIIETATMTAATQLAADEAAMNGAAEVHPGRVAEIYTEIVAARQAAAEAASAKRKTKPKKKGASDHAPDGGNLPDEPAPPVGAVW